SCAARLASRPRSRLERHRACNARSGITRCRIAGARISAPAQALSTAQKRASPARPRRRVTRREMIDEEEIDSVVRAVASAPPLEPRAPANSLLGMQIGNYHITRLLGEGGMGAVYLGEHPLIGKKVAVKVLHQGMAMDHEVAARFFTEARAVNDIHH